MHGVSSLHQTDANRSVLNARCSFLHTAENRRWNASDGAGGGFGSALAFYLSVLINLAYMNETVAHVKTARDVSSFAGEASPTAASINTLAAPGGPLDLETYVHILAEVPFSEKAHQPLPGESVSSLSAACDAREAQLLVTALF